MSIWMTRFGVIGELFQLFARGERKWLLPLGILLASMGLCLVLLQSIEYIAPFVYMAF
jgi:hypothetical protein